jgi:hypothetical protein
MRHSMMKTAPIFLGIASMLACGGDSTTPITSIQVGNYTAAQFVTTGSSGQTNQLAAGSTLLINLAADGTTTGHLHVPAQGTDPVFEADLAGTWTEHAGIVEFSQTADTFVKDMPFTSGPDANGRWSLAGDQVFLGTRIQVLLTKNPSL